MTKLTEMYDLAVKELVPLGFNEGNGGHGGYHFSVKNEDLQLVLGFSFTKTVSSISVSPMIWWTDDEPLWYRLREDAKKFPSFDFSAEASSANRIIEMVLFCYENFRNPLVR
jgi:hypothetical protein